MAITLVDQTSTLSGGSHNHTIPASVIRGDLLLWFENGSQNATSVNAPAGWQHVEGLSPFNPSGYSSPTHMNLMWKAAAAGEASTTASFSSSVGFLGASRIFVVRNSDAEFYNGTNPWSDIASVDYDEPASFTLPAVVAGQANTLVMSFASLGAGWPVGVGFTPSIAGWTSEWFTDSSGNWGSIVHSKSLTTVGESAGSIFYDPSINGVGSGRAIMLVFAANEQIFADINTGWGVAEWGTSAWGSDAANPWVEAIAPRPDQRGVGVSIPLQIRFTDRTALLPGSIQVVVEEVAYVINGSAANGATATLTANEMSGYDLVLTLPEPFSNGEVVEVYTRVTSTSQLTTEYTYYYEVGTPLRLISVVNPTEGILVARFNEPMRIDTSFLDRRNWQITPVSEGARELSITAISAVVQAPGVARLSYVGGGSTYTLSVSNLQGLGGNVLEGSSVLFELVYGTEDDFSLKLFDSIFGAVGISQRVRRRRTMDSLVANRSLAIGLNEQLRLKFQQLDDTAGRNGKPGKRRT